MKRRAPDILMIDRHACLGREFDWLAVDPAGQLAVFQTAGFGPAPSKALRHVDELDEAIETTLAMPSRGRGITVTVAGGNPYYSDRLAQAGFFAIDWVHLAYAYRLIAAPEAPLLIDDAEARIAELARLVKWPRRFGDADPGPAG